MIIKKNLAYVAAGIFALFIVAMIIVGISQRNSQDNEKVAAERTECIEAHSDIVYDLIKLDTGTNIGITYSDHETIVTDALVDFDSLAVKNFSKECKEVVQAPIENILDIYTDVNVEWDNGIAEFYDYEPDFSVEWTKAAELTQNLTEVIADMEEAGGEDTDISATPSSNVNSSEI